MLKTKSNEITDTHQAPCEAPETAEALRRSMWQAWLRSLLLFCCASVYVELCLHLCVYRSLDRRAVYLVLFGLLGKLGDKAAINAAAAYLGSGVYQLYRHFYRAAGANERYFSLPADACVMGAAEADRKLSELRYVRALESQEPGKFPDLSPEALNAAYPGQNQSLTQILSTADSRLSAMAEKNG